MSKTDPPADDPAKVDPPADPPADPQTDPPADPPAQDTTDWKAEARKWEARAKENGKAAKELEKTRQAGMSEAEKAIADAEAKGRTAAATDYGEKLAGAELRAAAAIKGVDLTALGDLIAVSKFVGEDGEVDTDAITKAVDRLAKVSPAKQPAPPRGSGDFPGGTGAGTRITEAQLNQMSPAEITKAFEEGKLAHLL